MSEEEKRSLEPPPTPKTHWIKPVTVYYQFLNTRQLFSPSPPTWAMVEPHGMFPQRRAVVFNPLCSPVSNSKRQAGGSMVLW